MPYAPIPPFEDAVWHGPHPIVPHHIHILHALLMVLYGPLSRHPLQAIHWLERHGTDVGRPCITDALALTLQKSFHRHLGEPVPRHPGHGSFGEFVAADGAA